MTQGDATRLLKLVRIREQLAELRLISTTSRRARLIEQREALESTSAADWRLADIVGKATVVASRKLAARIDEETASQRIAASGVAKASGCVEVAERLQREFATAVERQEDERRIEELSSLAISRVELDRS